MLHGFPFQTSKNALSVVENDDFTKVVLRRLPTDDKISMLVSEHANQHTNFIFISYLKLIQNFITAEACK